MTVAEYRRTPVMLSPEELIFGQRRVAEAPTVTHQRIVLSLALAIERRRCDYGGEVLVAPTDVLLDREQALVLQPDLLYISPVNDVLIGDRVEGAPDLVVEVLSPRPRIGQLDERVRWFARYGVREIWLFHQIARHLDILYCGDGGVMRSARFSGEAPIVSAVLPQFTCSVDQMLARQ